MEHVDVSNVVGSVYGSRVILMEILLLLITIITCIVALFKPWIGVIAYYILGVFSPKSLWPWIFQDNRISMFVAGATIVGLVFAVITKKLNFSRLNNKQTKALLLFALLVNISHFMSPYYGGYVGQTLHPGDALAIVNKTILFYLISVIAINDNKKLIYLVGVLVVTGVYYAIWSNNIYFSGQMWAHSFAGRLKGPGLYQDENVFSILFITSIPLIYFLASELKNKILNWSLLLCVPLAWHAIFLIGSRGALISLIITTLIIAFRSKSKVFGYTVLVGLFFAVVIYGGTIYKRSTETVEVAQVGNSEKPLNPRFVTWSAGWEMIKDNPLLGVGITQYQAAGPKYITGRVQVAHNTLIQISTEAGIFAGFIYLWFFYNFHKTHKEIIRKGSNSLNLSIANGLYISSIGFFICAIFLNMMIPEMLYFLLLINAVNLNQVNKELLTNKEGESLDA
jgi:O-antigen ligase